MRYPRELWIEIHRNVRVVAKRETNEIPRHTYLEQLAKFDAACAWLATFGVNVSPTRIGLYRRVLAQIEQKHRERAINDLLEKHGFAVIANVLFESTELIDIHEGLSGANEDVTDSLRMFTAGCTLLSEERRTGNNIARNVGFELDTTASFRQCGFPISVTPPADLWIRLGETPIAVECKRPFSYDALGANLDKAFSQLRQRYREHATPSQVRGIAALSASKMENDGSLMLKVDNVADLNFSIRQLSNDFVAKTEEFWDSARDDRTIGLVVNLRAPCHIQDINLFTVVRHFTWIGLARTLLDQELFRRVGTRM